MSVTNRARQDDRPAGALTSRSAPFRVLVGVVVLVLVLSIGAAFVLPAPWSWVLGFLYIAYDTWLLSYMVRSSQHAVRINGDRHLRTGGSAAPRISVLVAARNERPVLHLTLAALSAQTVQPDQIIVVDDGSNDGSVEWLTQTYRLEFEGRIGRSASVPRLAVLSLGHSGKASALNSALEIVEADVVVTIDADTILESSALEAIQRAFGAEDDLVAACGVLTPACAPGLTSRAFELFQTFEYLRAFLWRLAWMRERTLVLVSGAFAAFRFDMLRSVGGFDHTSRVEDYEVMFRLHRASLGDGKPLNVQVIGDARALTDAPGDPRTFLRQRTRWFAGFLDTMVRNQDMVGNRSYQRFGRFHLPVKTVDMLLPVYGLAATVTLVLLLVCGGALHPWVIGAVAAKFLFDVGCYLRCVWLYERWQGRPARGRIYGKALLATLLEVVCFQVLRQLGALLGWIAYLRGEISWAASRRPALQPEPLPNDATGD